MKLHITKKDLALIIIVSIIFLAVAVVSRPLLGLEALSSLLVISSILTIVVILEVYRRLCEEHKIQESKRNQDYQQIEALFSLIYIIKPNLPLPAMRNWVASPDILKKIAEVVLIEKPNFVVEASSGVSTLVIAYCLKQLGQGKVVSFEHDAEYAAKSQRLIKQHGLEGVATIVYAPLIEVEIKGQQWLWYNSDFYRKNIDLPIDLLIVDGPPTHIQRLSRYPALPLLYGHLNNTATIILDDGQREDEKIAVAMWGEEFSDISSEFLGMEKGAYLIHKQDKAGIVM